MARAHFKVGEIAKRTGLSIRTLHYYDEIGLLSPSHHTESGHRMYGHEALARLQQIVSLRELGFSLDEVRDTLERPEHSALRVVELHIDRLDEQIDRQRRLRSRLEAIARVLATADEISADDLIDTIKETSMLSKYYTPEQLEELKARREAVGEERIREVEAEWPRLMEEVRAEMDKGTDPSDPRVKELARRWMGLVREFTGGNPEIAKSVKNVWQQEESIHGMATAPVREMMTYIGKALESEK
jgi:DNA-binding transcriptional MerR regulator